MIKYLFQRDREAGFTLLELLVVLALSGTVLAAIFSFYVLGISNYTRGTERLELQQSVRLAADLIVREIRFADSLTILDKSEVMYTKKEEGPRKTYRIKHIKEEVVLYINQTQTKVASNIIKLDFAFDEESGLLYFHIVGSNEKQRYDISSSVKPRNL